MTFTTELANRTTDLRRQIHQMPFNRSLAEGSLPKPVFQGYVIQDAHYLEGFARALSLAAAKAPDAESVAQLAGSAAGAIAVERELHSHYMGLFGISAAQFEAAEVSAACDHYVSFLLRMTGLGDFGEAIAALLPCFWIYRDIGKEIAAQTDAANPYIAWIDTYSSDAFDHSVQRMLDLTDRVGALTNEAGRQRMHRAFERSCWHEWHFWDSAWHQRHWAMPGTEIGAERREASQA
ncbi:thiaminase II [Mameliella sediminis]|uniref:thiaminase II n=1 Tax=Mameliella sediminis TaxID=2836866 RepID=UPI001C444961|nr:thiaminase II [Mameliella sediminis]MBV7396455.1 thiaminase II [Mameliella sediminis]